MSPQVPTLHYFRFPGRALAARVALFNALGTEGWNDERHSLPRFKKDQQQQLHKDDGEKGIFVTNNLPQLNLPCGLKVTQSHAIARYAGKLDGQGANAPFHVRGLYPQSAKDALLVDEAVAIVDQILLLTPKDDDKDTRLRKREIYRQTGFLRKGLEILEGRIAESGGPFLLGEQLTVADLYVRSPLCDVFETGQFEGVAAEYLNEFPCVQRCGSAVLEHPLVQAYKKAYKT